MKYFFEFLQDNNAGYIITIFFSFVLLFVIFLLDWSTANKEIEAISKCIQQTHDLERCKQIFKKEGV